MTRLMGEAAFTDAERAVLFVEALKPVGTPWLHQGRTARGMDCIGYVHVVFARTLLQTRGIVLEAARADYGLTPSVEKLRAELDRFIGPPVKDVPRAGDVVSLRWRGDEHHLAIVVPHPYGLGLVHADNTAAGAQGKRVVYHRMGPEWLRRVAEVRRP